VVGRITPELRAVLVGAEAICAQWEVTFLAISSPGSRSLPGNTKDLSNFENPEGLKWRAK